MTNFLGQVRTEIKQEGQRIVIAAVEGAGKTTLLANAPRALFIPLEQGYGAVKAHKTPLVTSYDDLTGLMDEIRSQAIAGKFLFKTLSFDSATALERLIHAHVIASDPKVMAATKAKVVLSQTPNMETVHEGYGKGYQIANDYFNKFLNRCDELARHAGLNIVFSCHTFPSLVKDSAYGEYNSWDLLLHSPKNDKTYGKRELLTQWADMVGFLHAPLFVMKAEAGGTVRGIDANQGRQLAVDRTPGWVAKNRYGLTGLIPIPATNGWNNIADAVWKSCSIDIWNRDI